MLPGNSLRGLGLFQVGGTGAINAVKCGTAAYWLMRKQGVALHLSGGKFKLTPAILHTFLHTKVGSEM
jgi:hypothetical protein